jgi:hypothetical protein
MKRSIILDHYQNPYHRERHDEDSDYIKLNSRNVSCIDNIDLYVKMNGDKIEEICFDGALRCDHFATIQCADFDSSFSEGGHQRLYERGLLGKVER